MRTRRLRVVLIKPSKYTRSGYVERFRLGYMVNSTLPYLRSLTPDRLAGARIEVAAVDEYVRGDTDYLRLLRPTDGVRTLLALVGVQSHQLHRALDLAALARQAGGLAIIGGPHPMTCDTTLIQAAGVSVAQAEAELIWPAILEDAIVQGQLQPVYGVGARWAPRLEPPVLEPPSRADLRRYLIRMLGVYPARGCPYRCSFCSIIKIAGRQVRSQPVETTLESLVAAQEAGVGGIMFTSDNFNKYAEAEALLEGMIERGIRMPFMVQCDAQLVRQPELVALLARAGCYQVYVGVESLRRQTLLAAQKAQNRPEQYAELTRMCRAHGICTQFSVILGFPEDTHEELAELPVRLRRLRPDLASFYLLAPLPGTEQYDDFKARGLLREPNLDRYDATCWTWAHPRLSGPQLERLLFAAYRRFYDFGDAARNLLSVATRARGKVRRAGMLGVTITPAFARWCARRQDHPFSGGIGRLRRDHVDAYLPLRRALYGFELAPLPDSLTLSLADEEVNRRARLPRAVSSRAS